MNVCVYIQEVLCVTESPNMSFKWEMSGSEVLESGIATIVVGSQMW